MGWWRTLRYWAAVVCAAALVCGGSLWAITERFDWLQLWQRDEPVEEAAVETPAAERPAPLAAPPPAAETLERIVEAAGSIAAAGAPDSTVTRAGAVASALGARCDPPVPHRRLSAAAKVVVPGADTVSVTATAVGPGLGAASIEGLRGELRRCGARGAASTGRGVGGDGFSVTSRDRSAVVELFRNGDVVVAVSAVGAARDGAAYGNPVDRRRHDHLVGALDDAVRDLLAPVCAELGGSVSDRARNPYVEGYTGIIETRVVRLDEPSPPPSTAPSPTTTTGANAADAGHGDVAPSDEQLLEYMGRADAAMLLAEITEPPVPEPRWRPAPSHPGPAPTERSYEVRVADPVGPGCGWAFTRTVAPDDDADALAAAAENLRDTTARGLEADRRGWEARHAAWVDAEAAWRRHRLEVDAWDAYRAAVARLTPPPSTTTTTTTTSSTTTTTTTSSTTTTAPPATTTTSTSTSTTTTSTVAPPATPGQPG